MVDQNKAHDLYAEGRSAMKQGDLDLATKRFRQSIESFPHFKTLELLGECLLLKNQPSEAIVFLAASAGLGIHQYRARYLLAKAHIAIEEPNDAISQLRESLRLNPNYKSATALLRTLVANEE